MTDHNVAAGTNDAGHVAQCICGWRSTSPDLDTIALSIGRHLTGLDEDEATVALLADVDAAYRQGRQDMLSALTATGADQLLDAIAEANAASPSLFTDLDI